MKNQAKLSRQTVVINELGMHARPAAKIAEMAMEAKGEILLSDGTNQVDAASIIDILTMNAVKGTRIEILTETLDDEDIMNQIDAFFNEGFGEL